MQIREPIFIDDEPLVIEMMMNILSDSCGSKLPFRIFADPDEVADLIESGEITSEHVIVVDRFLYQRDTLDMQLPSLFRDLGFKGGLLIFSYIPIAFAQFGYDDFLKKDLSSIAAFRKWLNI